jgi:lysophospholipase L1-like esterase
MKKFSWILSILHILQVHDASAISNGAILVLGDSWASGSQDFLETVCNLVGEESNASRQMTNNGASGSTAQQWASSNKANDSFDTPKHDYEHVWLSIGGNDFLGGNNKCDDSEYSQISNNIVSVISDIIDHPNTNPNLKILYTGYGAPTNGGTCSNGNTEVQMSNSLRLRIQEAIADSAYSNRMVIVDIESLYVTENSSPFSDMQWYGDSIHINLDGYRKLFSLKESQEFFGCTTNPTDTPSTSTKPSLSPSLSPSRTTSSSPTIRPKRQNTAFAIIMTMVVSLELLFFEF